MSCSIRESFALGTMIGLVVGMLFGAYCRGESFQREAVTIGAAEWKSDGNGFPTFHWKTNK